MFYILLLLPHILMFHQLCRLNPRCLLIMFQTLHVHWAGRGRERIILKLLQYLHSKRCGQHSRSIWLRIFWGSLFFITFLIACRLLFPLTSGLVGWLFIMALIFFTLGLVSVSTQLVLACLTWSVSLAQDTPIHLCPPHLPNQPSSGCLLAHLRMFPLPCWSSMLHLLTLNRQGVFHLFSQLSLGLVDLLGQPSLLIQDTAYLRTHTSASRPDSHRFYVSRSRIPANRDHFQVQVVCFIASFSWCSQGWWFFLPAIT